MTFSARFEFGCGGVQPAEFGVLLGGCIGRLKRSLSSNAGPGSDASVAQASLNMPAITLGGFDFTAGECEAVAARSRLPRSERDPSRGRLLVAFK